MDSGQAYRSLFRQSQILAPVRGPGRRPRPSQELEGQRG